MKESLYKEIYSLLSLHPDSLAKLKERYEFVKGDTMEAIFRRKYQIETIRNMGKLMKNKSPESILGECLAKESVKIVAENNGLSVCALARYIMKPLWTGDKISGYLRQPDSTPHPELRAILVSEVLPWEADLNHPEWDALRRAHGEQMEEKLGALLRERDIMFYKENDLRSLGYAKTPDFKLAYPVGLLNEPVCWIESKGLFGDRSNHAEYQRDQYRPYIARFGPGAVVYWHGFVDEAVAQSPMDGLIVLDGDTVLEAVKNAIKITTPCTSST